MKDLLPSDSDNFKQNRTFFGFANQSPSRSAGLLFSVVLCGMVLISMLFSGVVMMVRSSSGMTPEEMMSNDVYKYCSFLLFSVVYIGVLFAYKYSRRQSFADWGYQSTKLRYYFAAILMSFGLLFGFLYLNQWFADFLGLFGYQLPSAKFPELSEREYALLYQLPNLNGFGIVGALFAVALVPAIMEETIFRGAMLEGMRSLGTVAACLLGGFLFSIFHQNPAQTAYQFVCGAAFTLLAIRSGSVWPTLLIHFINNAVIIFDAKFDFLKNVTGGASVALQVVALVCLIATVVWLMFFDRENNQKKEEKIKPFVFSASIGIVLSAVFWIANFITGVQ